MDLVARMLAERLAAEHGVAVQARIIRPAFIRRFSRAARPDAMGLLFNADRLLNRFFDYPRCLTRRRNDFAVFHILDHGYAHLVHHLPSTRTIVTCHDLELFGCILEPPRTSRALPFRWMTARIAAGLRSAAIVACDSEFTRTELHRYDLADPAQTVTVHNGVDRAFSPVPDADAEAEAARLLGACNSAVPEILHVGSTIARKRIDVLLRVFAEVRRELPGARLIRVSGPFSREQNELAGELGLAGSVSVLPFVTTATLAALYRRAALMLLTSDLEGFGMPIIESMACGTPVLMSDLPVLREVAGEAGEYAPVAHIGAWRDRALALLRERTVQPSRWEMRRANVMARAAQFSWSTYATRTVELYRRVAG